METTFDEDIVSYEQIFPILLSQCDIVAARMRREGKKCNCVAVSFRTLEFKNKLSGRIARKAKAQMENGRKQE